MGFLSNNKGQAESSWFAEDYLLVGVFSGWNIYGVTHGTSTGHRYGLPLFSGLPKQAQEAVLYFNSHDVGKQEAVISEVLVVNMTVNQNSMFIPNVIIANTKVVQINAVPGMANYEYFVTPNTPGSYTSEEPEYAAYNFSYLAGILEVV